MNISVESYLPKGSVAWIFSALLFVVTILPKLSSLLIILLLVFWVLEGGWKERFRFFGNNKLLLILPLFFLLHLISLSYSENLEYGMKKIETLTSLFILPLMIPSFRQLDLKNRKGQYKWAFLLGLLFNFIFCLSRSTILFSYEMYARNEGIILEAYPYTNYFFYSYLSYFMHYGYLAMYVNIGIAILLSILISKGVPSRRRRLAYLLLTLFSIYVILLYSKAGILALFMVYIYFAIYQVIRNRNLKSALISLVSVLIIGFVVVQYVPYTKERIQGMINGITNTEVDPNSHESTQLRVFVWQASSDLISENWMFGLGMGDAKTELLNEFKSRQFTGAYDENLNAHNQFLQTFINVGLIGVILLLLFFIGAFSLALQKKDLSLQIFVIITLAAFLAESYLQTQKGVMYTAVLSCLLLIEHLSISKEEN